MSNFKPVKPGRPERKKGGGFYNQLVAQTPGYVAPQPALVPVLSVENHLQRFDRDGIELVIDTRTGEAFATQKGYARMSGLTVQGIGQRVKKLVNSDTIKTAEIDTGYGVKLVNLIPAKMIFQWMVKDNPELAMVMGEVGEPKDRSTSTE